MTAGRPTKLTPEVQTRIVAAIQRGAYIETAVAMAGISKTTFYEWMKKANNLRDSDLPTIQPENQDLIQFADAIERAQAESEFRDIQAIDTAAQSGNWQAAAWKLERKHHDRWGRKVAVTDNDGGSLIERAANAWARALAQPDE